MLDTQKGVPFINRNRGAYLALQGYKVDQLDFTTMVAPADTIPCIRSASENGKPNQQDIIAIASAICPKEAQQSDPFWGLAAANYLSSYIAYVFEALPEREWTMASVIKLFESGSGKIQHLFNDLAMHNPDSYAASLYNRSKPPAAPKRCTQASWALSLQIYCRSDSRERSILTPTPTASTSARLDERSAPCS